MARASGSRSQSTQTKRVVARGHKRLRQSAKTVKVSASEAPVQQVVLKGDEPISARGRCICRMARMVAIYSAASNHAGPCTTGIKRRCRRMMMRGPRQAGTRMIAP